MNHEQYRKLHNFASSRDRIAYPYAEMKVQLFEHLCEVFTLMNRFDNENAEDNQYVLTDIESGEPIALFEPVGEPSPSGVQIYLIRPLIRDVSVTETGYSDEFLVSSTFDVFHIHRYSPEFAQRIQKGKKGQ